MPLLVAFLKGAVAGERGFEAGELCGPFVRTGIFVADGEVMNSIKPIARSKANIKVIGFVLRKVRDIAIVDIEAVLNWPPGGRTWQGLSKLKPWRSPRQRVS